MSKTWRPRRTNVVPLRPRERRRLYRQLGIAEPRRIGGATVRTVLLGAVLAGLVAGMVPWGGKRASGPDAPILWDESAEARRAESDPADAEWQARAASGIGEDAGGGGAAPAPRMRFGLCHTGGGTNCVVDGDTFYIGGAKVRIAGIDAPETHPPRCAEEARLGEAATARLQALLNSGAVSMTGIDRDRDSYGRLLRNVAVDGADVGEALVGEGVVREYGSGRQGWC